MTGAPLPAELPSPLLGGPLAAPPQPTPGPFPVLPLTPHNNPFTYKAFDLMTMTELDPLPYVGVSFGRQMNTAGPWSGTLNLADPRLQKLEYLKSSRSARTMLVVDYLGSIVWGGPLWTRRPKKSEKRLVMAGAEFHSWAAQRTQARDYSTTWEPGGALGETSPLEICKRIIEDAKEREHELTGGYIAGGINIVVNYSEGYTAAPPIDVSYPGNQLQTCDSIISTLSQMGYGQGFDYSYDVAYKPGTKTPEVTLNLWFPRQGRRAQQSGIVILDKMCLDSADDEDGTQQANNIHVTGSGSGGIQPDEAIAENVLAAGYPLLEAMVSHTQINNQSVLAGVSLGELAVRAWPVQTPVLEIPVALPDPQTGELPQGAFTFGNFNLGDDITRRIDPVASGMNSDPRWPNGLDAEYRIAGYTCTVNDKGVLVLQLDLSAPPLEEIPGPQLPIA